MPDLLQTLKAEKRFSEILIIQNRPDLYNVILLWKNFAVEFDRQRAKQAKTVEELWDCCTYNKAEFADILQYNRSEIENNWKLLKAVGLIYPDGTINETAEKFLSSQVVKMLPKGKK